jgi:hypothetical protein
MTLEITVFFDSGYKKNETFTMNVIGDIVSHKGRGRKRIIKEVEKRFPTWYSFDIHRTENKEVIDKEVID